MMTATATRRLEEMTIDELKAKLDTIAVRLARRRMPTMRKDELKAERRRIEVILADRIAL